MNKHKTSAKPLRNDQISQQIHYPKGVVGVVFVCTGTSADENHTSVDERCSRGKRKSQPVWTKVERDRSGHACAAHRKKLPHLPPLKAKSGVLTGQKCADIILH